MIIKRILVPTDFSEHAQRAFERACDLARQLEAKIHLLHIASENALRIAIKEGLIANCSTDEEVHSAVEKLIEERFAKTLSSVDTSGLALEHTWRRGDPIAAIPAYATEIGADLVVVGRRGSGLIEGVRAAVVGSVTEGLIRKSPCPVMIVRREH